MRFIVISLLGIDSSAGHLLDFLPFNISPNDSYLKLYSEALSRGFAIALLVLNLVINNAG